MTVTALFATAGADQRRLYPMPGIAEHLRTTGQFPVVHGARSFGRAPVGLLVASAAVIMHGPAPRSRCHRLDRQRGRADALLTDQRRPPAHPCPTGARAQPADRRAGYGADRAVTFVFTSLINEPASIVTLVADLRRERDLRFPVVASRAPGRRAAALTARPNAPSANSSRFARGRRPSGASSRRDPKAEQPGQQRHEQRDLERDRAAPPC